jgi:hypothetical protein
LPRRPLRSRLGADMAVADMVGVVVSTGAAAFMAAAFAEVAPASLAEALEAVAFAEAMVAMVDTADTADTAATAAMVDTAMTDTGQVL